MRQPRADALTVVGITPITVVTDLAIAIVAGIIFMALVFAREHLNQVRVTTHDGENGWRVYEPEGPLFFATLNAVQGFEQVPAPSTPEHRMPGTVQQSEAHDGDRHT
ncbi:MAG: hypothetical protein RBS17_07755 [Coriobacteriia bacterium]|nr:hypothetical protein [Coriobacteriia bacterium]